MRRLRWIGLMACLAGSAGGAAAPSAHAQETGLPPIAPDEADAQRQPAQPQQQQALANQAAVQVTGFRFEGNTVFSERQLLRAPVAVEQVDGKLEVRTRVGDYVGRSVTSNRLRGPRRRGP